MASADPGLYDYLPITDRPALTWPGDARLAVWFAPNVEFYELMPPVGPTRAPWPPPLPDVLGYSRRDYGNRVGVWRLFEIMDRFGLRASVALNTAVCDHHPEIIDAARERGWEFFSHGIYNTRYVYDMTEAQERAMIEDALATVQRHTGKRLRGWLSPALTNTERTPNLLADFPALLGGDQRWLGLSAPPVLATAFPRCHYSAIRSAICRGWAGDVRCAPPIPHRPPLSAARIHRGTGAYGRLQRCLVHHGCRYRRLVLCQPL
jgi:hypothetical protein